MTPRFKLSQTVYHRLNPAEAGIVTGLVFRQGLIVYGVTWSDMEERNHYDFELSADKSFEAEDEEHAEKHSVG